MTGRPARTTRAGARRLAAAVAITVATTAQLASPAGAGPREDYDARRDQAPHVLQPPALLGYQWKGDAPYIAGATVISKGELIHQDRPFDDTGADTSPDTEAAGLQTAYPGLCAANAVFRHGEYTYPADPAYARNGADLVELRIARDGDSWVVLFQLQTLLDASKVAARLTINGSHQLLLVGTTGTLDGAPVAAAADLDANTLEARFPAAAVPSGDWTLTAATGVPAAPTTTWVDAAFVDEPVAGTFNCWQDKAQSASLATGTLPTLIVDTARLLAKATDPPTLTRGPMVRLHAPWFANGEGIHTEPTYNQSTAAIYRGKLQPYAAYVPDSYRTGTPAPLLMLLHCLNCNHLTFQIAAWPGLADLAEQLGAIVVTPLAYGEGRHYESEAELDVFEVLTDVSQRYDIDRDRLLLSGMSMGSLGTFRYSLLYPDLWAATLGIGNYTTPYCVSPVADACAGTNYTTLFDNLRNVPYGLLNGAADELTPITLSRDYAERLAARGYSYRLWEYAAARHSPALHGQTVDVSAPWLAAARRVISPVRVTYVIDRGLFNDELGLRYDRAYWVRDLRLGDGVTRGRVDAELGTGTRIATTPTSGNGVSAAGPYLMSGLDPTLQPVQGPDRLAIRAEGLASLRIDAAAAGLPTDRAVTISIESATPMIVEVPGLGTVAAGPGTTSVVLGAGAGDEHPPTGGRLSLAALGLAVVALLGRAYGRTARA